MVARKKIGLWLIIIGVLLFIIGVYVYSNIGDCSEIFKKVGEIALVSWLFFVLIGGLLYTEKKRK